MNNLSKVVLVFALGLLLLAGCQNMREQPKLHEPYDESPTFGAAARDILPEAVRADTLRTDTHFYDGTVDGELASTIPIEITADALANGQTNFQSFCSPCHGYAGFGDGVIAREGFPPPASYHTEELRGAPVGRLYQAIAYGKGNMFDYAARLTPEERWEVVAYIRALQLSQFAQVDALPSEIQAELEG